MASAPTGRVWLALYLGLDTETAVSEYRQIWPLLPPGMLVSNHVTATPIVGLPACHPAGSIWCSIPNCLGQLTRSRPVTQLGRCLRIRRPGPEWGSPPAIRGQPRARVRRPERGVRDPGRSLAGHELVKPTDHHHGVTRGPRSITASVFSMLSAFRVLGNPPIVPSRPRIRGSGRPLTRGAFQPINAQGAR